MKKIEGIIRAQFKSGWRASTILSSTILNLITEDLWPKNYLWRCKNFAFWPNVLKPHTRAIIFSAYEALKHWVKTYCWLQYVLTQCFKASYAAKILVRAKRFKTLCQNAKFVLPQRHQNRVWTFKTLLNFDPIWKRY